MLKIFSHKDVKCNDSLVHGFKSKPMSTSQVGKNIFGKSSFEGFKNALAISKDGTVICIGGYNGKDSIVNKKGYVRIFKNNHISWVQFCLDIHRKEGRWDFLLSGAER